MPPEKTAMDEDGLPSLIEQGDGIIRDFRFVQQRPDVVGVCCAIPRWLVTLNFEIGVFPALPGASKAKSTQGTLISLAAIFTERFTCKILVVRFQESTGNCSKHIPAKVIQCCLLHPALQ